MTRTLIAICCLFIGTAIASAAFTEPTAEQITSAAENPEEITELLVDATPAQAEAVIKSVVAAIQTLGLKVHATQLRIGALFTAAFNALGSEVGPPVLLNVIKTMPRNIVPHAGTGLPLSITTQLKQYEAFKSRKP